MCTNKKSDAVPDTKPGVVSTLGNWMDPLEMDKQLDEKFDGCMQGELTVVRAVPWMSCFVDEYCTEPMVWSHCDHCSV